jgi:hypothetical protein
MLVFINTSYEIVCDPYIQHLVIPIREKVNVVDELIAHKGALFSCKQ